MRNEESCADHLVNEESRADHLVSALYFYTRQKKSILHASLRALWYSFYKLDQQTAPSYYKTTFLVGEARNM
jgi:hypothetical protein